MSSAYYYTKAGQQFGPVEFEQLKALAASGQLEPTDLVWTATMTNWAPAAETPGLFPDASAVIPLELRPSFPATTSHGAPLPSMLAYQTQAAHIPQNLRRVSYGLWIILLLAAIVSYVALIAAVIMETDNAGNEFPAFLLIPIGATVLFAIATVVYSMMILFNAWKLIPPMHARTSPGAAVGLLFIPLFNLYWIFQAYWGLSVDYNKSVAVTDSRAPALQPGLFLTQCILHAAGIIPWCGVLFVLVAIVLVFITTYQMCQAINYAHARIASMSMRSRPVS